MAKMYPSELSSDVLSNKMLRGEIKTYEALSKLPEEFEIFYDRTVNDGSARAYRRRIDFIVLHPHLGFLAIEVKGGKIRLGNNGGFEQFQGSKGWKRISPNKQVVLATIALIKAVKRDGGNYWIPDNTCVIFPEMRRQEITNVPSKIPDGTLCADDLPILAIQIRTLFTKSRKDGAWPPGSHIDMRRRLQNLSDGGNRSQDRGSDTKPRHPIPTRAPSRSSVKPRIKKSSATGAKPGLLRVNLALNIVLAVLLIILILALIDVVLHHQIKEYLGSL